MKKLKTLIIEDDERSLDLLLLLLNRYPERFDLNSIQFARSFDAAQTILLNGEIFDVSFIDKFLDEGKTCHDLILDTNRHALGIIVLNTIDKESEKHFREIGPIGSYLVLGKPFNKIDLADIVGKINEREAKNLTHTEGKIHLFTDKGHGTKMFKHELIVYIEMDGKIAAIFYDENGEIKKHTYLATFDDLVSSMSEHVFFKIGRGLLINRNYIDTFTAQKITFKKSSDGSTPEIAAFPEGTYTKLKGWLKNFT